MGPEKLNKYLYIEKTPTWLVRGLFTLGLITWGLVVYGYGAAIMGDTVYRWVATPIIAFFTLYTVSSFGLNLFYVQFDLKKHFALLVSFWNKRKEPSVDVFLPICGEEVVVLDNTWQYVSQLKYKNIQVYVLDDSPEDCEQHEQMAKHYGFHYFARPNKGEMKKAGNLKYGYERTKGEFIVIFDADFAPHKDFLRELLPYMGDPKVGIVQSPQYFEMTERISKRSALEYGGANVQECFYRFIQVVRDRFGATVCCGTNAIYRRAALDVIGGTVQAGHSEDQRTGFALQSKGWIVRYVPIILAIGLCPDAVYQYFHQQHRWCTGNIDLMMSKEFWTSPVSWKAKYCYITGFLFYVHHLFALVFSLQLFYWLLFYNTKITLGNGILFYPYLGFTIIYIGFFSVSRTHWNSLYALAVRLYSYGHSIIATLLNSSVGWVATGAKQLDISAAFRQTIVAVELYLLLYAGLFAFAVREGVIHVFNYNYYPIEFWLLYNLGFSALVLWAMYKTVEGAHLNKGAQGFSLPTWRVKTAGAYVSLASGLFLGIMYFPTTINFSQITHSTEVMASASAPTPPSTFPRNLVLRDRGSDVHSLQAFLNANGFTVTQKGPGSFGNETNFFGRDTYAALVKFQKTRGLPATGYFGPQTRSAIDFGGGVALH